MERTFPGCRPLTSTMRHARAIGKVRWATTSRQNPAQPWLDARSRRLGGDRLCSDHECAHLVCRMAGVHSLRLLMPGTAANSRRPSMRRRILANRTRGTATSASWNTTYRPWRTIRAPILTSFSRSVVSDLSAKPACAGSSRCCRRAREAGGALCCAGRPGRTIASSGARTCLL